MSSCRVLDHLVDRIAICIAVSQSVDEQQFDGADDALIRVAEWIKKSHFIVIKISPRLMLVVVNSMDELAMRCQDSET